MHQKDQDIRFAFHKVSKPKRIAVIDSDEEKVEKKDVVEIIDPKDFFSGNAGKAKAISVPKTKDLPVHNVTVNQKSKENLVPQKRSNESAIESPAKMVKAELPKSPSTAEEPKKKLNYFQLKAQKESHQITDSRPAPVGAPNSLEGKTFVFTGDLNSISREVAADYVKKYGGYQFLT